MIMLEVTGVEKYFNKGTPNEMLAVNQLSLQVAAKEFAVIIGFNGSGKTTLLNLVAGSYFPDKGTIVIDGKEVTHKKDFERSKWVARIFQDPMAGTAPDLTIIDNFRLAALRSKRKTFRTGIEAKFKNRVRERLAMLNMGLENKLNILAGKLSGGQRQALTLLMAVMDDSKILLLDEPTAALDPKSSETVMRLADAVIKELQLTAILVTHDMHYAAQFGTRLIMMQQGKIIKDMSTPEKQRLKTTDILSWF